MIEYTLHGVCLRYNEVPKGATIDSVNNRIAIDVCENCGKPILEGQKYEYDTEGIYWHKKCRSTGGINA